MHTPKDDLVATILKLHTHGSIQYNITINFQILEVLVI